ncbi:glycosyltransferase family 9 protein [Xanthobacteraceae bacterium Astr-EGSB]|uniref:glycosyltransferase family 9 protein n=1 Tax=Astrobacterium formosum TaxID=3069710 RepID=UPI0027B45B95|nr:glycosyltransferase family 9 protein [Xanthobacteraceae bacterium Astr-EGSB]
MSSPPAPNKNAWGGPPPSLESRAGTVQLPERARILVVVLRRIGDVLLTTPLIRSLRRAWPNARIEALVFADTAGILAGNPDLDGVVVLPARPSFGESFAVARRLFKRYHLAVSTQSGDRPTFFALLAGRRHAGPVDSGMRGAVRKALLGYTVPPEKDLHRVPDSLRLAGALGIAAVDEVVCPRGELPPKLTPQNAYAVIHAQPMFRYKRWTSDGWRAVAQALSRRGLTVIASGGPGEAERQFLDLLWSAVPEIVRLDGRLTWRELAALLGGARVYVGPDTSVTHLAAAAGCPTVALYGPTDPRLWGPWPRGGLVRPWAAAGRVQQRGNVWLVQNPLACLPCQGEGCAHRLDSHSRCLDELSAESVISAIDQALAAGERGGIAAQSRIVKSFPMIDDRTRG